MFIQKVQNINHLGTDTRGMSPWDIDGVQRREGEDGAPVILL